MIAVDTHILVYAHRRDAPGHARAIRCLQQLVEGTQRWALPWPCVHEFLAIATHPRVYSPPSASRAARRQLEVWLDSPSVTTLAEEPGYLAQLAGTIEASGAIGPRVHDARIAALCRLHGVRELWTADRDFALFPGIAVINPLLID